MIFFKIKNSDRSKKSKKYDKKKYKAVLNNRNIYLRQTDISVLYLRIQC